MKYRFFAIPALAPSVEQEALNAFCAVHRVVTVDKHFFAGQAGMTQCNH